MKTSTIIGAVVVLIIVAGGTWYWMNKGHAAPTYIINGQSVTLVNGRAETPAAPGSTRSTSSGQAGSPQAGSASKVVTQYFGNVATGDLNGDGAPDVAFLLTQTTGGSGTFYYVVATLVAADGSYQGTNAVLLGDRIAPQTTEIRDGGIIVNYAERKAGEPMTTEPSVGVSKHLNMEAGQLVEVQP